MSSVQPKFKLESLCDLLAQVEHYDYYSKRSTPALTPVPLICINGDT